MSWASLKATPVEHPRDGASGYLTKESAPEELVEAIRKVARGGKYISASLGERLAYELEGNNKAPHERLSDREYQVLYLYASGMGMAEIADHLSLSVKTVSTYRTRVMEKMKLSSNSDLTYYALKNGLIQ